MSGLALSLAIWIFLPILINILFLVADFYPKQLLLAPGEISFDQFAPTSLFLLACAAAISQPLFQRAKAVWNSWTAGLIDPIAVLTVAALTISITIHYLTTYPNLLVLSFVLLYLAGVLQTSEFCYRRILRQKYSFTASAPIRDAKNDKIGRMATLQRVLRLIKEDHQIIAVVGDFGDGKSSVLQMLPGVLPTSFRVVRFNSWLPSDQKDLTTSFYKDLATEIEKDFALGGFRRAVMRMSELLSGSIPIIATIKNVFADRSQEQTLADYASVINAMPSRIVVMIDEIDRMEANELRELFRILRASPNAGRLTFVCALNKHAVAKQLSETRDEFSSQYAFIEKFFPIQIELSRIEPGILQNRFVTRIKELENAFSLATSRIEKQDLSAYLDSLWAALGSKVLTNFRKVDLYLESLETLIGSAPRELNFLDAILIEIVKSLNPAKYDEIYQRGYIFYKLSWTQNNSFESPMLFDEKEKAQFRELKLKLYKEFRESSGSVFEAEMLDTALDNLFYDFHVAIGLGRMHRTFQSEPESAAEERRIYHPDYFGRYFTRQAAASVFTETEYYNFLGRVEKKNANEIENATKSLFEKLDDERRMSFARLVERKMGDQETGFSRSLILEMIRSQTEFKYDWFEVFTARRIIFRLVRKMIDQNLDVNEFTKTIINSWGSVGLATDFVNKLEGRNIEYLHQEDWQKIDSSEFMSGIRSRFEREFSDFGDVLKRSWLEARVVLFTWERARADRTTALLSEEETPADSECLRRLMHVLLGPQVDVDSELKYVRLIVNPKTLQIQVNQSTDLLNEPDFKRAADRLNGILAAETLKLESLNAAGVQPSSAG